MCFLSVLCVISGFFVFFAGAVCTVFVVCSLCCVLIIDLQDCKDCSVRVMCSVCRVFCLQPMLCVNFRLRRLQRRQLRCYVQLVPRLFFVVNAVC